MAAGTHCIRGGRRAGLLSGLAVCMLLASCGGRDEASTDGVVTTGPEPGAQVTPAATPAASAAASPAPTSQAERRRGTPTTTPTATASGPTPTMVPAQTLKPKEPTDAVDLAFARQMLPHQLAANSIAQTAASRGQHAELRAFGARATKRRNSRINTLTRWGDVLGLKAGAGLDAATMTADMRTLGANVAQMNAARALLKAQREPFTQYDDDAIDDAVVDALIESTESGIVIATGTIEKGGSKRFRTLAAQLATSQRKELKALREMRRSW